MYAPRECVRPGDVRTARVRIFKHARKLLTDARFRASCTCPDGADRCWLLRADKARPRNPGTVTRPLGVNPALLTSGLILRRPLWAVKATDRRPYRKSWRTYAGRACRPRRSRVCRWGGLAWLRNFR